jgi:hypothetical protein
MKKWMGMMVLAMAMTTWMPQAKAFELYNLMSIKSSNPFEVWRKMRPQDFIGAPMHPTLWQIIV